MVRYILYRPVGVLLAFIALIILGGITFFHVPISLLPNVNVPEILIRIDYPNTPAATIEQNILAPIRENLNTLGHLKTVESRASNNAGIVQLRFDYGTRMNLAYIEVNEKLDRLPNLLPADLPRPQVIRVSTADIPIMRIQVIPKKKRDYLEISELTNKVLVKRLEQLNGISVVDVNGAQKGIISVSPYRQKLFALNMDEMSLAHAIQTANQQLGSLSVKDGQYRYYIRLGDPVSTIADIANLPIRTPGGTIVPLARLAAVQQEPEIPTGYHLYNGEKGLVITIQKQPDARMTQLVPRVKKAVARFQKDYPQIHFAITRNQTSLLHAGIDNLKQDLLIGGILAIAILFLFLGNYASPTLMSISIPVSLIISCIFFYIFNISFNIISLSGLTLGIGILIDNSIVVLDRITLKRRLGLPMDESCITGTNEIMIPVINAVLTTVAAYVPLIYLSGLAGALIFDQSIALSISLGVSLLVAFILTPLLYKLMVRGKATDMREDTRFYAGVLRGYHQMIRYVFRYKRTFFIITLLVMPIGFFLASHIPISALPQIEKQESLVSLNWNAPIGAKENLRRMKKLDSLLRPYTITREMEIGTRQFLTQHEKENSVQQSEFYYKCKNESLKVKADRILSNWLSSHYSHATWDILDAPNAFTKLFSNETPYFEARFRSLSQKKEGNDSLFNSIPLLVSKVEANNWKRGAGLIREPIMDVTLNERKMMRYNVNRNTIENTLQELFGRFTITQLKHFGDVKSVRFVTNELSPTTESLLRTPVKGTDSSWYPLNNFIRMSVSQDYRFITADKTGSYKSIVFPKDKRISYTSLRERLRKAAVKEGLRVSFTGQYFSDREQLKRLVFIFLLVFSLMYFLMALEFESLIQPLIALFVIPLGVSGAMIILLLSGGSLNVMAAIGFVVILGMIVDNPILMVETINLLRKRYGADQQMVKDPDKLEDIIHEAGEMCLKPLLMVSLTTILALIPILFFTGIGNDLEKPLALVVIGGLSIGTFFTIWFVPLAYWFFTKKNKRS